MEDILDDEGNNIGYYCNGWLDKQEVIDWILEECDDSLDITIDDIEYMYLKEGVPEKLYDDEFPECWDYYLDFRKTEKDGYKKVTVYGEPT
jgi:hypothetical protein